MPYEFKREDAFSFADYIGAQYHEKGDELHFEYCPRCGGGGHGDRDTFSINLVSGAFNCLRSSCDYHGHFVELCRDFDYKLDLGVPKIYKRLRQPDEPIKPNGEAVRYMQSRGISPEITTRFEITSRKDNRSVLVFPFYDDQGTLTFLKYRNTKPKPKQPKEWCEVNTMPILFGMKQARDFDKPLVVTEGQCFDGKAEVLTPDGWVLLEDYGGQDIMQVDCFMNGSFVKPKQYIVKRHVGNMVRCKIGGNYETYTTDDHNLVLIDSAARVTKVRAIEKIPSNKFIPTAISHVSHERSSWSNEMFALYLATSADGTLDVRKDGSMYARFAFAKERKSIRLREILNTLKIDYSDNKDARGYDSICFKCPGWLNSKYLPYWFATETTADQKEFILQEMVLWDGNRVPKREQYEFNTTIKHNADVIQLVSSLCGHMSTIMTKANGGNENFKKSFIYKVSILLKKSYVSTQQFETHKTIEFVDQRVYCVTVDTGMILVRQNGKISVSGNCDSLSLAEAGIPNAVSVPTGANGFTWLTPCYDWVCKFSSVIVFGDYENGKITLLDTLKARLPMVVKAVRKQDYLGEKDANAILQKYGTNALRIAVENAEVPKLENVKDLASVESVDMDKIDKIPTGILDLDKTIGGMCVGQVVLLTGKRGEGKSTFGSQLIANALDANESVFIYSGELAAFHAKRWLDYQLAGAENITVSHNIFGQKIYNIAEETVHKISEWYRGRAYIYDNDYLPDGKSEYESLPETIEKVIRQYGTRFVFIDNLMTAMDAVTDKDNLYLAQSNFVGTLKKIAMKYNVVILLVAHPRKSNTAFSNDDVSGSSDITNKVDVVLSYGRAEPGAEWDSVLQVSKNRLWGKLRMGVPDLKNDDGGIVLNYSESTKRIVGRYDRIRHYGWEKQESIADDDLPFD